MPHYVDNKHSLAHHDSLKFGERRELSPHHETIVAKSRKVKEMQHIFDNSVTLFSNVHAPKM